MQKHTGIIDATVGRSSRIGVSTPEDDDGDDEERRAAVVDRLLSLWRRLER